MTKQTCCIVLPKGKKCRPCWTAYNTERQAVLRKKKSDLIKKTRSVVAQKRSIYYDDLCKKCRELNRGYHCHDCKVNYKKAAARKYWRNKSKKLCVENRTISENKAINGTGSLFNQSDCHANEGSGVKTNASKNKKSSAVNKLPSSENKAINCTNSQSNKTDFGINEGNSGVGGSDSSGVDSFILGDDINGFGNKQKSKYAHLFCSSCQFIPTKKYMS